MAGYSSDRIPTGAGTGVNYNPERLKLVWDELLAASGVRVALHATLVAAEQDAAGRIIGIVISTKTGFHRIAARRFIDASGEADLCALAGIDFEKAGDIDPAQTLTTTFRLANVDLGSYRLAGGKKMLAEKMAAVVDSGSHPLPRTNGSLHEMNTGGCVSTVAVRVADVDATDFEQLTRAEAEGRRQAFTYERFLRDCVPGFAAARIIGLSHQIGMRETRRVRGEYRLTRGDCDPARLHVWWLGQSGFLLCHRGPCLLFDPYLSDSLTRKYAGTDKPHVRMTAHVVASSHNHTDHPDADTLVPLFSANPEIKMIVAAANAGFVTGRLGAATAAHLVPLADGQSAMVGPFAFEAVPAAHEELSPAYAGFVVTVGGFRIYHSGDTLLFP